MPQISLGKTLDLAAIIVCMEGELHFDTLMYFLA